MEHNKVIDRAGWYASYMKDDQGKALVRCMHERIKQDEKLFSDISGEIELVCNNPQEIDPEIILYSIKQLIENRQRVIIDIGYFSWEV